jgi:hypothetical protein
MPRGVYKRADRKPTWTHVILEAMKTLDDFMTAEQIGQLTGANNSQVSATLHHFKNNGVAECLESDGKLWWYLTGEDKRTKTVDERVPEEKGHRTRRKGYSRKPKPTPPPEE